jgi:hypothetical protein
MCEAPIAPPDGDHEIARFGERAGRESMNTRASRTRAVHLPLVGTARADWQMRAVAHRRPREDRLARRRYERDDVGPRRRRAATGEATTAPLPPELSMSQRTRAHMWPQTRSLNGLTRASASMWLRA